MKRTIRVGAMVKTLTDAPNVTFPLEYFCQVFDAAKSSISEDIALASEAIKLTGTGYLTTVSGHGGGVCFVPSITDDQVKEVQRNIITLLKDPTRILGGGFLYTSDIMYDSSIIEGLSNIFARKYIDANANYVATIETKGIPLASATARKLNLPLIIIRREAKISEGSTVSINYFSDSYDRVQKMSIAKRAVIPGSKAIIIDDFMRGGGSAKGITEILEEFDVSVIGTGIAISAAEPIKKKVPNSTAVIYLEEVDETHKIIDASANCQIF